MATHALADSEPAERSNGEATSGGIDHSWEEDSFSLDWSNNPRRVARADTEFLGSLTAVPGDYIYRTLNVRNSGPSAATLSLYFRDWQLAAPRNAATNWLVEESRLVWSVGEDIGKVDFATASASEEHLATQIKLEQGEQVAIRVGWEYPYESTKAVSSYGDTQQLSFGIRLLLSEVPDSGVPTTPDVKPAPKPKPGGGGDGSSSLPFTGTGALAVLGAAALFALAGMLLLLAGKRRKAEDESKLTAGRQPD
jgi:hypothetical protein